MYLQIDIQIPTSSQNRQALRPLGLLPGHDLTSKEVKMLQEIESYDLWFVIERIMRKKTIKKDKLPAAILFAKRYFALKAIGHEGMVMVDDDADEVWHNFILFTREYIEFCEHIAGRYIHHTPETSKTALAPGGEETFWKLYHKYFGQG